MAQKFRKKPVEVEAMQYDGANADDIVFFMGGLKQAQSEVKMVAGPGRGMRPALVIRTLEGDMTATKGDYIIRGVNGEFYPCKPDIFAKTYEPVLEPLAA